jgi:hypothetical protein
MDSRPDTSALPRTTAGFRLVGINARRLAGDDFRQLHRGVHVPDLGTPDLETTIRAAGLLVPPDGAVGGWAAAWWHGVDRLDGNRGRVPILVCLPRSGRCRRDGLVAFRSDLGPGDVVIRYGVRVTSPLRTCFDLVRRSVHRDTRVATVDAFRAAGYLTPAQLVGYASDRPGWRGVGRVMPAARLSSDRTESLPESLLRLAWVVDAGLPEPLVNPTITDVAGRFVARVDMLEPGAGLVIEYDGAHHLDEGRRAPDHLRQQRLEELGLMVVRFARDDLAGDRRRLVARCLRAHEVAQRRRGRVARRWRIAGAPMAG